MALSLQARFWRFLLRTMLRKRLSIEQYRANDEKNARLMSSRIPGGIEIKEDCVDDIRTLWILPTGAHPKQVILYFHGGGYVTGSLDFYRTLCIPMAQSLHINMILPQYRLAPEHPFPAALDDALHTYRWLLQQGYRSDEIIVSGDSAGGGLSLAMVLALRDAMDLLPAAVICMSPWTDLSMKGQSYTTKAKVDPSLLVDVLQEWAVYYAQESDLANPLISPIYADFHGLPPLLIQVGTEEVLLDDSVALAEKAKADGADVTLKIWDQMWHVWPVLGDLIPESRKAFAEMNEFLQDHIKNERVTVHESQ